MNYKFDFSDISAAWPELLAGLADTLWLASMAMVLGLVVSVAGAVGKTSGPKWLHWIIQEYIELIRNTPLLIQLFVVYFGLPALGVRLSSNDAALLTLVVNVGAYGIEIIRGGIESVQQGQVEAAKALGLRPMQTFRYIVLKPAIQAVYPSLTSLSIILLMNTSVCSVIAANELTAVASNIQSQSFRSFEIYFVVTLLYLGLSAFFWTAFSTIERVFLRQPTR